MAHNSSAKPDILSSLMTTNLSNMNNTNNINKMSNNLHNPYNTTGSSIINDSSTNNWQQTPNSWHSANPLVMNNQLPAPSMTAAAANTAPITTPNNNFSSLDNLDPFGNTKPQQTATTQANTFTLQKPTVDYIYPVGYNQVKPNANSPLMGHNTSMNMNSMMNSNSAMAPLMPQSTSTNAQSSHDSNNLNTLSHQDILSFLN